MIDRILIATDDGGPARSAVEAGVRLAIRLQARIALLHVVDTEAAFRPDLGITDEAMISALRVRGRRILDETAKAISDNIKPEKLLLLEGDPSEAIISAAADWSADLIVIGSDSRGRLAHFLLGSTADAVIRRAPCPVVTVRENGVAGRNSVASCTVVQAGA